MHISCFHSWISFPRFICYPWARRFTCIDRISQAPEERDIPSSSNKIKITEEPDSAMTSSSTDGVIESRKSNP